MACNRALPINEKKRGINRDAAVRLIAFLVPANDGKGDSFLLRIMLAGFLTDVEPQEIIGIGSHNFKSFGSQIALNPGKLRRLFHARRAAREPDVQQGNLSVEPSRSEEHT